MPRKNQLTLDDAAALFAAFADVTRLRLLSLIERNGEICVCDLIDITGLPQTKISKHLAVLRKANLVRHRREGTWMHYSMQPATHPLQLTLLQSLQSAQSEIAILAEDLRRLKMSDCCTTASKPIQIEIKAPKRRNR